MVISVGYFGKCFRRNNIGYISSLFLPFIYKNERASVIVILWNDCQVRPQRLWRFTGNPEECGVVATAFMFPTFCCFIKEEDCLALKMQNSVADVFIIFF